MKKLTIPNGGMPLEGDDFNWIHGGVLEAFKALYFGFGLQYNGNFIISGCSVSFAAGFATITEGYVMLDWEICYCPPQTVGVTSLASSSLKVESVFDVEGLEVFADSVSRDTYENRRAIISDGLNSGVEIPLDTSARYEYSENVNIFSGTWGAASGSTPKCKRKGDIVHLSGAITGGETNLVAFNLPSVFRPGESRRLRTNTGSVFIDTNGDVLITTDASGGSQVTVSAPFNIDVSYML